MFGFSSRPESRPITSQPITLKDPLATPLVEASVVEVGGAINFSNHRIEVVPPEQKNALKNSLKNRQIKESPTSVAAADLVSHLLSVPTVPANLNSDSLEKAPQEKPSLEIPLPEVESFIKEEPVAPKKMSSALEAKKQEMLIMSANLEEHLEKRFEKALEKSTSSSTSSSYEENDPFAHTDLAPPGLRHPKNEDGTVDHTITIDMHGGIMSEPRRPSTDFCTIS